MLLRREVENSSQSVRQSVMRGIRHILLGKGREDDEGMDDEEMDGSQLDVFKDPVIHMLQLQSGPKNLRSKETGIWLGRGKLFKCKGELPGVNIEDSLHPEVLLTIWNLYTLINPFGPDEPMDLLLFKTRRLKGKQEELRSTGSGVGVIGIGDAVQVLVNVETKDESVITPCTSNDGFVAMYCVFCLIDDGEYGIVMGVLKCETEDNVMKVGRELKPEGIQLLPANEQVRRVGIVHACHEDYSIEGGACKARVPEGDVIHNLSLMKGGSYYFMKRETGYPSRMA